MFHKIVDVLKEVFWIKPSRKKPKTARRKSAKRPAVKKKALRPKPKKKGTVPLKKRGQSPFSEKPAAAKPVKPRPAPKAAVKGAKSSARAIDPSLTEVGNITHYFDRIKVCVVQVTFGTVLIGDKLTVLGPKTKFIQKVWSMQIESEDVKVAKKGQLIGLKVDKVVSVGDKVYK
ncbi:MAG: hypothetical protein KGK03_02045 [Candidatus Omnitrophica bacterium]|nr:hypothetical protein [Candidatus Omnitrophota bacterium]MDE2221831.1 hypothetical protein [Candidatus Omnitrophota bacterium]